MLLVRLALQPLADDALRALGDIGHGTADLRRVGQLEPRVSVLVSSAIRVLSVGSTTSYIKARRGADLTMLSGDSGGQPRGAGRAVQAGCGLESGTSGLRYRQFASLCVLALAGCSSFPSSINPVSWWHGLEGGKIAKERPPPPGADQPYPNLATVPPKPAQPDRAALDNIASALVADRSNAQHVAAEAPIADPSVPGASPALFGRGTVPPPPPPPPSGTAKASATMAAAEAPPAPPTPSQPATGGQTAAAPAKAPVGAVQSTPLAPPGAAAQPPPSRPRRHLHCQPRPRRHPTCRAFRKPQHRRLLRAEHLVLDGKPSRRHRPQPRRSLRQRRHPHLRPSRPAQPIPSA